MINLYPHQEEALKLAEGRDRVAFYHDMGLGKTFTGAEQLVRYGNRVNLVVCQKSKINDWVDHFKTHYCQYHVFDLTKTSRKTNNLKEYLGQVASGRFKVIGVINYELLFRRPELRDLTQFTLMLDESSLIQNEKAKRTKFILEMSPSNVILLSGSPTGGRYERLYSQLKLLGMRLNKTMYYNSFVNYHFEEYTPMVKTMVIDGYKNVPRLKRKMRELGCQFLKTEEVLDLPAQIFTKLKVAASKDYHRFTKHRVANIGATELVGDNTFKKLLYERELCGQYSREKLEAFKDLLESTEDRLIVFYNFNEELYTLQTTVEDMGRPTSVINGFCKDLNNYALKDNSVTFVQYQAGAMGLNLQLANKIVYYSPPLSSELYEQSKKRTHRIGQDKTCFYYNLIVKDSVEEKIYRVLAKRQNYTEALFEEDLNNEKI